MATVITYAGESLIASKQAAGQPLELDTFVLALVPGQDPDTAVDRSEGMPDAANIVHTYAIPEDFRGYVNPNQVVYSMLLGSDLGNFSFNWLGLVSSTDNAVVAISHLPEMAKWKTDIGTNTAGNNLTRNMLLEFSGAQAATGITVEAATWQVDFTARLHGIDERERLSNRDIFGRALFWGDACRVINDGALTLQGGTAYIEGLPIRYTMAQPVQAGAVVSKDVWLDVSLQAQGSDVVTVVSPVVVDAGTAQADYTDAASARHYLVQLASIDADGVVTDLRTALGVENIADNVIAWIASLTAADLGAAPANHTHTPASLGAAEEDHIHLTEEIVDLLPGSHTWIGVQIMKETVLPCTDTLEWDMSAAQAITVTLDRDIVLVPINIPTTGRAEYSARFIQDGTGNHSVAHGGDNVFRPASDGGVLPEVAQEAGAATSVHYESFGTFLICTGGV